MQFQCHFMFPGNQIIVQVNLFQKPSFLYQSTHNMMRYCSLNCKKNTSSEHVLYKNCFCFHIQNNICTKHFLTLYFSCNSMNNLSSYYWLNDSRTRASEKDLHATNLDVFWMVRLKETNSYPKPCVFDTTNNLNI